MKKSGISSWFIIAVIIFIITIATGTYESVTQKYKPQDSIVNALHAYGYLNEYQVRYEPSKGIWHILGWTGSAFMVTMMLYSVRKRFSMFAHWGALRHWLSAHIFLGIMGALLVTLHTTFKLGGIVATSFWSMIITVIFGILGRYIYIQIPQNVAGTDLQVNEINKMVEEVDNKLRERSGNVDVSPLFKEIDVVDERVKDLNLFNALYLMVKTDIINRFKLLHINKVLKTDYHLSRGIRKQIVLFMSKKAALIRRKNFLSTSHRLLRYWHVLHVPLAIVMFIIMFLHVGVYFLLGGGF
ncbi:MAG: hypothetical protein AAB302_01515 [Deltaproteobacteria bacterium]